MLKERIDVHGHYFPPAYQKLLRRHNVDLLDGVKAPVWSIERQWEYMGQNWQNSIRINSHLWQVYPYRRFRNPFRRFVIVGRHW